MTNREKYKQAFSVLHASGGEDWDTLAGKESRKGRRRPDWCCWRR